MVRITLSRFAFVMLMLSAVFITGCTSKFTPPIAGGDQDERGCIGSAGYQWCDSTQSCERPWELAEEQGFENSAEAFARFCETP